MDHDLPNGRSSIFEQNIAIVICILTTVVGAFLYVTSSPYITSIFKRFIRIQIQKRLIQPYMTGSDTGPFVRYYRNVLCHLQKTNDDLLANILKNNYSSAYFRDHGISFLSSHRPSSAPSIEQGYTSVDEFRRQVPLTVPEDYRSYIDRMIANGEKNQLIPDEIIYFSLSSGTTGKPKAIPMTRKLMKKVFDLFCLSPSVIWRSLPASSYPAPEQRTFFFATGRRAEDFPKSKSGIPMGPFSQLTSAVRLAPGMKSLMSSSNVLAMGFIEQMPDFRISTFVQLVFALAIPDLFTYTVLFAPEFVHTIKLIEIHFEEMCACIASADFNRSVTVQSKIHDQKLIHALNRALNETAMEYGGAKYRSERAKHIQNECLKKDTPGLLHRLWPKLVYASTAIGAGFVTYKEQAQYYCGEKLPVINCFAYMASEGCLGTIASIYTDEYLPTPTSVFVEFIREEDVHQTQPKTLLLSEIEPGHRYEVVCTTESGLVRYRMGDIIQCTRFLTRAKDLVPLPAEPQEVPRIPLLSVVYRIGNLLNVFGEKTSEQDLLEAFKLVTAVWKEADIRVNICDFTCYVNLDACPPYYVIYLEIADDRKNQLTNEQYQHLQNTVDGMVEENLAEINFIYGRVREAAYLDALRCFFVQPGTFSNFIHDHLLTDQGNPAQIKPHRFLKHQQHIQFFHDHQFQTST